MRLLQLSDNEKDTYQSFVSANGSFLQDWSWGEFQKKLGREVLRFAVIEKDPDQYLLTAQIIRNVALKKEYFFVPYGPIVSNHKDFDSLSSFFFGQLKAEYPSLLFIRIEPQFEISSKSLVKTTDINPHKTLILDLQKDLEQIKTEMHSKTRYNIKVAQKHDVQVEIKYIFGPEETEIFRSTAKRAAIRFQNAKYFADLLTYFSDGNSIKTQLYVANYRGEVLAVNLMLYYNRRAIYLFGGSSSFNRNVMAPYALHWQAVSDAKSLGYQTYDFWGVEEDPKHPWYGFSKFKLGFGGSIQRYGGTYDYVYNSAWYNVYKILRKLNRLVKR